MRLAATMTVILAAFTSAAAQNRSANSVPARTQTVAAPARAQTVAAPTRTQRQTVAAPDEAQVGLCIRKVSGKAITEEEPGKNFLPASILKLVTCGAALECLGADFRFQTTIAYSGKIGDDGMLCGDLHIVGGGDPTLGAAGPYAVPKDSLFARWTRAVRAAGIRSVAGSVVGDSRRMPGEVNGSWMYEDMATYYGATCSALMFNRNCIELELRSGAAEGDPVNVGADAKIFPEVDFGQASGSRRQGCSGKTTGERQERDAAAASGSCHEGDSAAAVLTPAAAPWMTIENRCVTGPSGSGDQSYLFISEFAPAARLGGSFALGKDCKTVSYNNPFADFSCAYEFARHLASEGIPCKAVTATSACHPTAVFRTAGSRPATTSDGSGAVPFTGSPSCTNATSAFGAETVAVSETVTEDKTVFGFSTFDTCGSLAYSGHFAPQDSLTTITVTYSPRLSEIARETLRVSDNLYAETLLRALTLSKSSDPHLSADTEEALEFQEALLKGLGLNLSSTRLADGSGLSRKNSVSPSFMVSFLTAMSSRPCFSDFLGAINTPGPDESLFSTADAATRRRIRLKSGSMTGVRCYSGYILPSSPNASSPNSSSPDTTGNSPAKAASKAQSSNSTTSTHRTTSTPPKNGDITVFSIMINDATLPQSRLREYIGQRLLPYLK